jgi:chromosome segregation ATPase
VSRTGKLQPPAAPATLPAMHSFRNLCGAICLGSILISLSACGVSNAERDRKREEDRMAIHLTEAQRQLDQSKAQLEKAQSALAAEQGKNAVAQQQIEGLRGQLKDAQGSLAKETAARASDQAAASDKLHQAQDAAAQAQKRIGELTQEKASLEQKLSASPPATAPASTMPEVPLNK